MGEARELAGGLGLYGRMLLLQVRFSTIPIPCRSFDSFIHPPPFGRVLAFLLGCFGGTISVDPAASLVFVYAVVDKFYLRNPAMFYSICFILITALAVSGLRSDFGVSQSLVSRYRIYSNLMLVFVYLYVAGRMQWQLRLRHTQLAAAGVIACVAIGFNVVSSYAGFKLLRIRTDLTNEGLRRWEHGEQSITTDPGALDEDPVIRRQRFNGNYEPQDRLLHEAISLHIYEPPAL